VPIDAATVERLLSLGNDLGLFSEEYDVANRRPVGDFPQAFTHLTLVGAAKTLANQSPTWPSDRWIRNRGTRPMGEFATRIEWPVLP
jgi:hypothetical protein